MKVLGLGEIMIQLNPLNKGPLRHANIFERHVAGSEANVIIGMSRLGFSSGFLTAVGNDEFGKTVISTLRSEGIDTKYVKVKESYPTAVYFVQRGFPVPAKTDVFYYRKGSSFSMLTPDDIEEDCFKDIDLFHVSGITPALSESCKAVTLKAIKLARENGAKISFDTNVRKKLLMNTSRALACLEDFIKSADYLITGKGDLDYIFPGLDLSNQLSNLARIASNNELIIVKMGKSGVSAYVKGELIHSKGYTVEVADELGAGDAFDAAFLASIILGKNIQEALRFGNAAGAIVVGAIGDIEPLPGWKELETFLSFQEFGEKKLLR
ncbi:MAG: sugar kinase [Thermotoga sp.]|nr:MAG: sugar kinase [Thermotoga sp.]